MSAWAADDTGVDINYPELVALIADELAGADHQGYHVGNSHPGLCGARRLVMVVAAPSHILRGDRRGCLSVADGPQVSRGRTAAKFHNNRSNVVNAVNSSDSKEAQCRSQARRIQPVTSHVNPATSSPRRCVIR
ncbi:hypothetical protein RHE_PD00165 (plasmid) [Rhizobium etli CFN 42]|uniref:Uncharacterized protein n=1 Tax=Rhizobium etli (strain ATCC 51251 / DSM 11541 / JCM 21823 / NBRC 15573 / CFN 42) TaxID=347834 RepID=Q8KL66_RHIEC|nr:hypothetical protein RHE_PD00165 [Rhizobium etli CFN 42]